LINLANSQNIQVAVDLHTWYTTWDDYFRDSASGSSTYRNKYITYETNVINSLSGSNVLAYMVLNEPQARKATTSENNFIIQVANTAKSLTSKPVSVRFMGGYSPSTGHYATSIDQTCNYLCRNSYWDPKSSGSVYGCNEQKLLDAINVAHTQGKEFWITEFGKSKNDLIEQSNYVSRVVNWSKSGSVDKAFCWVSQPDGGSSESYNIFTNYEPNPAFYKLINEGGGDNVANVIFNVNVKDSSLSTNLNGVSITLTVTKPDTTIETITLTSDTSGNASTTKQYTVAGTYKAKAVAKLTDYNDATSNEVSFDIAKVNGNMTVTLNVSVG
jgi:hypothetical protein